MGITCRCRMLALAITVVAAGCADFTTLAPMRATAPTYRTTSDSSVSDPADPEAAIANATFRFEPPLNDGVGVTVVGGSIRTSPPASRIRLDYSGTMTARSAFSDASNEVTVVNHNECTYVSFCEKWEKDPLPNFCAPDASGYAPGMDASGSMIYKVIWLLASAGPKELASVPQSCPRVTPQTTNGTSGTGGYMLIICTTTKYYSASGEYLYSSVSCRTEIHAQ